MHVCVCVDKDIYIRIYVKLWYMYIIEVTCALSQQMEFSLASKEDQDWCSLCLHGRRLWISESTAPLCVSLQSYMWVSACCPGEDLGSLVYPFNKHLLTTCHEPRSGIDSKQGFSSLKPPWDSQGTLVPPTPRQRMSVRSMLVGGRELESARPTELGQHGSALDSCSKKGIWA